MGHCPRAARVVASCCVLISALAGCGDGMHRVTDGSGSRREPIFSISLGSHVFAPVVADDFGHPLRGLSPWRFVDPQSDGSVADGAGHLQIRVAPGSDRATHDVDAGGDHAPRVLQPAPRGDFSFDAKFDSRVDAQFQEQGIVSETDATHYVYAGLVEDYFRTSFVVGVVSGAIRHIVSSTEVDVPSSIVLRLTRLGTTWSVGYSYDAFRWATAARFSSAFIPSAVGVFAGNVGNTAPAFTALVDWFVNSPASTHPPAINVWYGSTQTFGQHGEPQPWINLLGDVADPAGIAQLTYTIAGGTGQPLELGANATRLAGPGDFNVELATTELEAGRNRVTVYALDNDGRQNSRTVIVNYVPYRRWPLPTVVRWQSTNGNPDAVAQVADGLWRTEPNGTIRTAVTGYDRLVTLGDADAWTNYVVTVPVTIHSMNPDGAAVGIIVGWEGASAYDQGVLTTAQPQTGHPFPAAFVYANTRAQLPKAQIYANTDDHPEQALVTDRSGFVLAPEVAYTFKVAVSNATGGGTGSRFRFKIWRSGTPEPAAWLLDTNGDGSRGSVALVAHRADVSFGTVIVTPA